MSPQATTVCSEAITLTPAQSMLLAIHRSLFPERYADNVETFYWTGETIDQVATDIEMACIALEIPGFVPTAAIGPPRPANH